MAKPEEAQPVLSTLVYRHGIMKEEEARCLSEHQDFYEISVSGVLIQSQAKLNGVVNKNRPQKCRHCGSKYNLASGNSSIFINGVIQR